MAIEQCSFDDPWSLEEFQKFGEKRGNVIMVAEQGDQIVGFYCYQVSQVDLVLSTMAVHPDFRLQGVGRQILEKLQSKLSGQRNRLIVDVPDDHLNAQLFLRACGLRCVRTIKDAYDEPGVDAYRFLWTNAVPEPCMEN